MFCFSLVELGRGENWSLLSLLSSGGVTALLPVLLNFSGLLIPRLADYVSLVLWYGAGERDLYLVWYIIY